MRLTSLSLIALIGLSACATSGVGSEQSASLGPVDEMGFVARDNMAFYHVATGLYCPSEVDGLLRNNVIEYRKDVDVGCNYRSDNRAATFYLYETSESMSSELEGAVSAALQGGLGNRLEISEDISEACQLPGMTYNLMQLMTDLVNNDGSADNTITIDPSGATGPMPYMAYAMEGTGIRSYAAVSETDMFMLKVRYTVNNPELSDAAISSECKTLHRMTATAVNALNRPDGPELDGAARLLLEGLSDQSGD